MKKILFLAVVLLITMFSFANAANFYDVPKDHWAYNAIDKMVENGVVLGYPDSSFKPDNLVTRAEFAKIVVNALKLDLTNANNDQIFEDVDSAHWAFPYVNIASKFLTGYKENGKLMFRPDRVSVREDVAVAIVIASEMNKLPYDIESLDRFTDADTISSNLKKYVAIAVENGLINGYDDGSFRPKASLTRAQVCQLMVNLLDKTEKIAVGDPEQNTLKENQIKIEGTDFIFDKQDFSIDLGSDWRNCATQWYKAAQRHLSYDSASSNSYKKYKNESEQVKNVNRDDYSSWYSLNLNKIKDGKAYCDVRNTAKGQTSCYVPIPFLLEVKTNGKAIAEYSHEFIKSKSTLEIKATTLNNFDKLTYELFYYSSDGQTITIIDNETKNNSLLFTLADFNGFEEQFLRIKVYDEYGNYDNYLYTFVDSRLKDLNYEYYSLLSNGIEKKNGKQTISVSNGEGTTAIEIPAKVVVSNRMLDGSIYKEGKPIFVRVGKNSSGVVEQLIEFNEDHLGSRAQYIMNMDFHQVYLGHDDFNTYVYNHSDLNEKYITNTTNAKKWMCTVDENGFKVLSRSYALQHPNTVAYVVSSADDYYKADYFFISNYPDENPIKVTTNNATSNTNELITKNMKQVPDGQIAKFMKTIKKGQWLDITLPFGDNLYGRYWNEENIDLLELHSDEFLSQFESKNRNSWMTMYGVNDWAEKMGFTIEETSNGSEIVLKYVLKGKTYYSIAKVEKGHAESDVVDNMIFFVMNNDKSIKINKWKEVVAGQTTKLINKVKSYKSFTLVGNDATFDSCTVDTKNKIVNFAGNVELNETGTTTYKLMEFINISAKSRGEKVNYSVLELASKIFGFDIIKNGGIYGPEFTVPAKPLLKYKNAYKIINVERKMNEMNRFEYELDLDELGEFISYVILNNKDIKITKNK